MLACPRSSRGGAGAPRPLDLPLDTLLPPPLSVPLGLAAGRGRAWQVMEKQISGWSSSSSPSCLGTILEPSWNHLPASPRSVPSGYVKIAIENGPVEIVSFPMKNVHFPSFCVCLPGRANLPVVPVSKKNAIENCHLQWIFPLKIVIFPSKIV